VIYLRLRVTGDTVDVAEDACTSFILILERDGCLGEILYRDCIRPFTTEADCMSREVDDDT
jgi:hypothetical protein